jgi:cytochrome c peroxidase
VDVGRQSVSERPEDWAAFKVPSLRNVARSAPYLHNGSVDELEEVVRFMGGGGFPNRNLTPMLIDRALTDTEVADLTAFLGSLSCGDLEQPTLPS